MHTKFHVCTRRFGLRGGESSQEPTHRQETDSIYSHYKYQAMINSQARCNRASGKKFWDLNFDVITGNFPCFQR